MQAFIEKYSIWNFAKTFPVRAKFFPRRRADGQDAANGRFSQFCENVPPPLQSSVRRPKKKIKQTTSLYHPQVLTPKNGVPRFYFITQKHYVLYIIHNPGTSTV